nr:CDP-alcohol phosphatidyltransferase family protein [Nocardioides alpinus]
MLAPFINLFIRLGISPDVVTLVGTLGVSVAALVFFPMGLVWQGVLVITAFIFSDLVDGAMARKMGRKDDFGAFLDSTLDRVADGALFAGLALFFAWQAESRLYLALCLVILVMGAVTSYARAKADHLGYDAKVGIAERPDRLVGMLVPAFFADVFDLWILLEVALWALAVAATVTVAQRIWVVRRQALARAAADG